MDKQSAEKMTTCLSDKNCCKKIAQQIYYLLSRQFEYEQRSLIFLCIGSERYTGDALGPLIGTMLVEDPTVIVYGTLDEPVHAGNLADTINYISEKYNRPIIIAIDACLGKTSEIGNIEVWEGGLEAGIAVGNKLPSVGNISIVGVVNSGGQYGYFKLQSTPLSIVMKLMKVIAVAIQEVISVKLSMSDGQIAKCGLIMENSIPRHI